LRTWIGLVDRQVQDDDRFIELNPAEDIRVHHHYLKTRTALLNARRCDTVQIRRALRFGQISGASQLRRRASFGWTAPEAEEKGCCDNQTDDESTSPRC